MIDDTDDIAAVKTVGRSVIPGIGVVEHCDRHTPESLGACHCRYVGKKLMFDRLQGAFGDLTTIFPMASHRIGEVIRRLRDPGEFIRTCGWREQCHAGECDDHACDKSNVFHTMFPHWEGPLNGHSDDGTIRILKAASAYESLWGDTADLPSFIGVTIIRHVC